MENWIEKYCDPDGDNPKQMKYVPTDERTDELTLAYLQDRIDRCKRLSTRKHCSAAQATKLATKAESARMAMEFVQRRIAMREEAKPNDESSSQTEEDSVSQTEEKTE